MGGQPAQQALEGTRSPARTQAERVVELKDELSKAKDKYDEEIEELMGLMKRENLPKIRVDNVTFALIDKTTVKIEGYQKPTVGE